MINKLSDKEWLKTEYVDKRRTAEDIAKELGCEKSSVCRAMKRLGIEMRKRTSKYAELSDEAWLRRVYVDEGHSLNEIAEMVGSTAGNVHAHLVEKGIQTRSGSEALSTKYPEGRFGDKASNWKGGRRRSTSGGYIYVYTPEHPNANKQGYVMEHRLVMEAQYGRYLRSDEDVHHVNGIVDDNRPENLAVVSRSEHKLIHSLIKRSKKQDALQKRTKEQQERIDKLEAEIQRLKLELKGLQE